MFTTDGGRKAPARPRAAPSTFAQGRCTSVPAAGEEAGMVEPKVRCLMIGYPAVYSMSLSVPKPK